MRAEVVAVGTELLLGQIVDTNSAWIGEHLALAGIDCHRQLKVGDNLDRIVAQLAESLERSDAVVVCGGLGPTQDDLTRDAIARLAGVELVRDQRIEERIRAMFRSRGRDMPANNLRQADVPVGATTMAQQPGTAPGLVCPIGDKVVYAMPGVPSEMKEMLAGTVIPDLRRRSGDTSVILSRVLRTWGQSESGVAEQLAGRIDALDVGGNPTIAFLASGIEGIKVRITAKAPDADAALALLDGEEAEVRAELGDLVFGLDDETMEAAVARLLADAGLTVGLAESLTGGLMASRLSLPARPFGVFGGGLVLEGSSGAALLGTAGGGSGPDVLGEDGVRALADAARRALGTDVGLAVTGVGGPQDEAGYPVGTVFVGVALGEGGSVTTLRLPGDRDRIRSFATISAFDRLRRDLLAAAG
jgi:nicotinamide-nucleotide amidase